MAKKQRHPSTTALEQRRRHLAQPEYYAWNAMKQRCSNPRNASFKNYGGRGISVCARWAESFEAFIADMGPRPKGLTIDRLNNDGNYEPSNCRWATREQQIANSRKATGVRHGTKTSPYWERAKGEQQAQAVLTAPQVLEIRLRAARGERPTAIARAFGVTSQNVNAIAKRKTWKHI
jgi:hypothetical protein